LIAGRTFVIGSLLAGVAASTALAQLAKTAQTAVDAYRTSIASAASARAPRAIENAFSALGTMREALMQVGAGRGMTPLESLSEGEFQILRKLPGAIINRDETVFVEPDPDYFVKLAAARGEPADRAFFSALKTTRSRSGWPVYIEQQTDYSGCIRFGSMSLVETYRAWSGFQRRFGGRYAAGVRKEIDDVLQGLTTATCACRDVASAEMELRRFQRDFPASPARAAIDRRLQAIREGRSDIRANCVSG